MEFSNETPKKEIAETKIPFSRESTYFPIKGERVHKGERERERDEGPSLVLFEET
jgi:hypothetical protein